MLRNSDTPLGGRLGSCESRLVLHVFEDGDINVLRYRATAKDDNLKWLGNAHETRLCVEFCLAIETAMLYCIG